MIREILAVILMYAALAFMAFGLIGLFRFRHFHSRILVTSKVETVGFLTMMLAIVISAGLSYFSLKTGLITAFVLMTNPIATNSIAHSAIKSGYEIRKDEPS